MTGVPVRRDSRRIVRSVAAAAQGQRCAQTGNTEQAVQRKPRSVDRSGSGGEETLPPGELQEVLWKQFFADTGEWWDNRWSKPTPRHPDFRHKQSKVPLWLNNRHKPVWVDSQLATMDAGSKTILETGSTTAQLLEASAATEIHLKVRTCRKLCEDGAMGDAVDALDLLVQQGCHIPCDLFYHVLKRCRQKKDLAVGRCIHALSVKSGYEGDAFLATHLIGLYASSGMLEEAMSMFTKVSAPDAYNWAAIIFAYARHGEGAEAVRLYRQMCQSSTVKPDNRLYSAVLKACAAEENVIAGKEVHAHIVESSEKPDRFVQTGLVNMYARCGYLGEARRLFDELTNKTVVTWTVLIAGYVQQGLGQEALDLYRNMQQEGLDPDSVTFGCLLQACATVGVVALSEGRQLHAQIQQRGLEGDAGLGGSLVDMYVKCGGLDDARKLFDELPDRTVVTWTAMIAGYAQQGMGFEALKVYRSMQQEGLTPPNSVTYVCLLQACASVGVGALQEGKQLHAQIEERGLEEDAVVARSLVNMYAKCGSLEDARRLFDKLPDRNIVAWNAIIAGYAHQGRGEEALSLYSSLQQEGLNPTSVTFVSLLQACACVGVGALHEGKKLHSQIEELGMVDDVVLGGSLVNMYAKCGSVGDAQKLFDKLPERNVIAWNALIAGYALHGMGQKALSVYSMMRQGGLTPSSITYICLLQACASLGVVALHEGKKLHVQIEEQGLVEDAVLGGSLVDMYAKCGSLEIAHRLFDKLPDRNVVAWNAIIAGCAQQGMLQDALSLYKRMLETGLAPDPVTYSCLLHACASVGIGVLEEGKKLHAQMGQQLLKEDVVLGGSLVNMYAKCGSLDDARRLFEQLPSRDVVAWNAMILGYAQQGMGQEALSLYRVMQQDGITPNSATYVPLLQACAAVAALPLGEQLHAEIERRGMQADLSVGAALVNMYAKCGSMYNSQRVFDSLANRSVEAWGALLSGYARQGDSQVVFDLVDRMRQDDVELNEISSLSVLTVCSHVGLVDKGREYFKAMKTEYGISPTTEHYICMVDLLGRAGHLHEALQMAKNMPFPPNEVVWHTLLGSCHKWKNVEVGQQAFEGAVSVDEKDASAYVLMSNIYASIQMWEAAKEMKARRMKLGAWKKPGQSWWTDMEGVVHTFLAGDKKHPESEGIYGRLEQLIPKMQNEGCVPHLESSLLDASDKKKQAELCGHSERLALAYALDKTADGATVRIVKNFRVCEDCHTSISCISKLEGRTIICRDASRFHVSMCPCVQRGKVFV